MSGIFGYCNYKENRAGYPEALAQWNRPYGREAEEIRTGENWALGCCLERLSSQNQPSKPVQQSRDSLAVIDAVLYNRDQLLPLLSKADQDLSDEALLLRLLEERGMEILGEINGDFAGAIFRPEDGTWILFRDHMGIRPLYYRLEQGFFAFSTDIRGLTAPGDAGINESQLFLRMMGYNDLSLLETEYENIRCLPPASWVTITPEKSEPQVHSYWQLGRKKLRLKNEKAYVHTLRELVTDAVKRRLDAVEGLVGGELSGGLDSGVVDILISRLGREGRYFSWSASPLEQPLREGEDERKIIRDICLQENITCQYFERSQMVTPEQMVAEKLPGFVNTLSVSQTAARLGSQGVRAIFTGHGGDEGVSHRMNLTELWYHGAYGALAVSIWDTTRGKRFRLLRTAKRLWRQFRYINPTVNEPYHNTQANGARFLREEFKARMEPTTEKRPLPFAYDPVAFINQGGSRRRLDNLALQGAQQGVRYMIPFLDYRVIDFAVSIPRRLYLKKGLNRWIFREAFRDLMPESLRQVRYKDTPSQRGLEVPEEQKAYFRKVRSQVLAWLDRDFWKDYLDFEAIQAYDLPREHTPEEYTQAVLVLDQLMQCVRIQNASKNTGNGGTEHGCDNEDH